MGTGPLRLQWCNFGQHKSENALSFKARDWKLNFCDDLERGHVEKIRPFHISFEPPLLIIVCVGIILASEVRKKTDNDKVKTILIPPFLPINPQ